MLHLNFQTWFIINSSFLLLHGYLGRGPFWCLLINIYLLKDYSNNFSAHENSYVMLSFIISGEIFFWISYKWRKSLLSIGKTSVAKTTDIRSSQIFFLFSPSKGTLLDKVLLSSRWPSSFFPTCNSLTNLDFSPNWSYCVSPVSCELSNIGKFLWLTRVKAQSRLYSILSSLSNQKSRAKHHALTVCHFYS